jgi:hypothetical protein
LLRASYSRYVNQITSSQVTPLSPGAYSNVYYYFNDVNHNNNADPGEVDFAAGLVHGALPSASAGVSSTRLASGLKAPITDEIILGGERELFSDFSVGVNGTWRKLSDFVGTVGEHTRGAGDYYSSADYVLSPTTVTATLPDGSSSGPLQYYLFKPGVKAARFFVLRNTPDYYQNYKGLELTATKRMSNRWMLRGNFTYQDWTQHVGPGSIVDPTRGRLCGVCNGSEVIIQSTGSGNKGNVYINSKWAYSLTGAYQIPIIETSFGFNLNERQGYADPYVANITTVANTGASAEGTKALLAASHVDSFRNDNVRELDLRLAKDIRIQRVGLTFSIDLFNALNAQTVLQRNLSSLCATSVVKINATPSRNCDFTGNSTFPTNQTATSNRVVEVLSPRVFRLGARLSF